MNEILFPMEWNVFRENINARQIEVFNIFNHMGFRDDFKRITKKFKDDKAGFAKEIRRSLFYYMGSKSEYEVLICSWPYIPERNDPVIKVDPLQQIMINWDAFIDYVWERRKEVRS